MAWQNRIVGHGMVRVDQVVNNPRNWRIHTKEQLEALLGAIEDIGFIRSITINQTTGNLVDGHGRVLLADRNGIEELPAEFVMLTEQEEWKAIASIDPISALARPAHDVLDELLADIHTENPGLQRLLDDLGKSMSKVPTLEELSEQYGEADVRKFWPWVKLQVEPSAHQMYLGLMKALDRRAPTDEATQFANLLHFAFQAMGEEGLDLSHLEPDEDLSDLPPELSDTEE